jgi:flagellar protein FlaG
MIKDVSSSQTNVQLSFRKTEPQHRDTTSTEKVIEQQDKQYKQTETKETKEQLEKVVKGMNDFLKPTNTHLKFEFHDELKEYFVTIRDNETNEVVKEIPPRKLLDMYAAMTEYLGLLVDKKI